MDVDRPLLERLARFCVRHRLERPHPDNIVLLNALAHRFVAFPDGLELQVEDVRQQQAIAAVTGALAGDALWELIAAGLPEEQQAEPEPQPQPQAPAVNRLRPVISPEHVALPPGIDEATAAALRAAMEAMEHRPGFVPRYEAVLEQVAPDMPRALHDAAMGYLREVYQGVPQKPPAAQPPRVHAHRHRHRHRPALDPPRPRDDHSERMDAPPSPVPEQPIRSEKSKSTTLRIGVALAIIAAALLLIGFCVVFLGWR